MTTHRWLWLWALLVSTVEAAESIQIVASSRGVTYSCATPGAAEWKGSVMEAGYDGFRLDLCLPTQDCRAPIPADFHIKAPGFGGFGNYLKPSAYVSVALDIRQTRQSCVQRILIRNLGHWLGDRNPLGRPDEFYFSASDGGDDELSGSPFRIERCPLGKNTLRFVDMDHPSIAINARVGETVKWVRGNRPPWEIAVLQGGSCSSGEGWAYWVSGEPPFQANGR